MEPWTKNDASKEELEASLNQSLVNYIDNNLPELEGKLEQAIGIYVLLNSILCYDDRYIKSKSFKEIEKINNINEENPYSVCRQWAIIYQKLLDYYNIKSTKQIGYIPNFGSKQINDVTLSKDSNRLLITGKDNKLYIVKTKDVLYSENTIAPPSKQFTIDYKTKNPNAQKSGITEFLIDETLNNHIEKNQNHPLSPADRNTGRHAPGIPG